MKRQLALAFGFVALLAAAPALPCGGGFGTGIAVNPQQDIIIVWKDGVETYAFQPTFCGWASNFGLILPVPAQVSQQPALIDQQAFTKAIALSEPTKVKVSTGGGIGCGSTGGSKSTNGGTSTPTCLLYTSPSPRD